MSELTTASDGVGDPEGKPARARGPWRRRLELSWVLGVVLFTVARLVVARETLGQYGLNIWVFGVIDLVTAVPYAVGTAKLVGAMVDRNGRSAGGWAAVAGISFIAPYLYVASVGTGGEFPGTVYYVLGALILLFGANAVWSVLRKIRAGRALRADGVTGPLGERLHDPAMELVEGA